MRPFRLLSLVVALALPLAAAAQEVLTRYGFGKP